MRSMVYDKYRRRTEMEIKCHVGHAGKPLLQQTLHYWVECNNHYIDFSGYCPTTCFKCYVLNKYRIL